MNKERKAWLQNQTITAVLFIYVFFHAIPSGGSDPIYKRVGSAHEALGRGGPGGVGGVVGGAGAVEEEQGAGPRGGVPEPERAAGEGSGQERGVAGVGFPAGQTASRVVGQGLVVPYSHRVSTHRGGIGVENRKTLLFFMGNRFRPGVGEVRELLFQALENEEDVIMKYGAPSQRTQPLASQGMHSSKFCLHPAGSTPASCRLFDAIHNLCVPVIVSDSIELPFEDVIDYRKIAIFVQSTYAVKQGFLVTMLRNVTTERILEYQQPEVGETIL